MEARARRQTLTMSTIRPTHSCFDDAIAIIERLVRADPSLVDDDRFLLVHGIAIASAENDGSIAPGTPFAHAWIEYGEDVWQRGILDDGREVEFALARADFYRMLQIQASTRYTMREVWIENSRTRTTGPWRPEYVALCRQAGTVGKP